MTYLLVLYHQPATRAALAVGPLPYPIATLDFDNMADPQNAMSSPEGLATAADLGNFADAGATILAFDKRSV